MPSVLTSLLLACLAGQPPGSLDSDGDGLADSTEDTNANGRRDPGETDPCVADTDGDGTPDGEEIAQGTDPSRNGLLEFPEPMVFDMVRGLGAKQWELEGNVLLQVPLHSPAEVIWAPEVEFAFADWHAIELEVGGTNDTVEALKLGLQGTVRDELSDAHGWQLLLDYNPDDDHFEAFALYVGGLRLGRRGSLVSLIGPLLDTPLDGDGKVSAGAAVNSSLFVAAHERLTVGLEGNLMLLHGLDEGRAMPQLHWQINSYLRVQTGVGYVYQGGSHAAEATLRVITET